MMLMIAAAPRAIASAADFAEVIDSSRHIGVRNFLDKVYAVATRSLSDDAPGERTAKLLHRTIKKVTGDIEGLRFNTAVSQMMIYVNHLHSLDNPPKEAIKGLLLCLSPFAPHLAEELWQQIGQPVPIAAQAWPAWDESLCEDETVEMAVQINGKVRSKVVLAKTATEDDVRELVLQDPKVQAQLEGKGLRKLIYVPGRIVNLIIK